MDAEQLKSAFAKLPPFDSVPEPHTWDRHRYEIRKHVANDDIGSFLQWSTIQATMFVGDAPYVKQELQDLPNKLYDAVRQSTWIGNPPFLSYAPFTNGNMVHQATHLRMLLETIDVSLCDLQMILEFGGGYGTMALLCDLLGFTGGYLILDLPELCLLQKYYLSQHKTASKIESVGVSNWGGGEVDLFIACYSISEAPQKIRDYVLEVTKARYYLFAIQEVYAGLNLKDEFRRITDQMDDVNWTWIQNPYFYKHSYIIGERCES